MEGQRILILMPVFDDWRACGMVLRALDEMGSEHKLCMDVLLVDDGSTASHEAQLESCVYENLGRIDVLRLRRNLGHQRAIAVALCYVDANLSCDTVVVMDSDGEDDPRDVPSLLEKNRQEAGRKIVFASRAKRSETLTFRLFYRLYKMTYWLLTGKSIAMGNFSVIPRRCLRSLAVVPELWSHYAAAVVTSRTPYCSVPTERAKRLDGESRMNFVGLVTHGLSAISVFSETVSVRVLLATLVLIIVDVLGIGSIVAVRILTDLAIPGWATFSSGLLLTILVQAVMFAFVFSFLVLNSRNEAVFLPARDYVHFVDTLVPLFVNREDASPKVYRLGA